MEGREHGWSFLEKEKRSPVAGPLEDKDTTRCGRKFTDQVQQVILIIIIIIITQ